MITFRESSENKKSNLGKMSEPTGGQIEVKYDLNPPLNFNNSFFHLFVGIFKLRPAEIHKNKGIYTYIEEKLFLPQCRGVLM